MIAIIDYGMGNLRSVEKAFAYIGQTAVITSDTQKILEADRVVLPGVGAFGKSMENLTEAGMVPVVREVIASGRPFLGICLGLQMLFEESAESFGNDPEMVRGLGILKGNVLKFESNDLKIPQIGWNKIKTVKDSPLFHKVDDGSFVYFVHSYYVRPDSAEAVACTTDYGIEYCSGVSVNNLHAVQFHPEKSSQVGLQILKNFAALK